MKNYKSKTQKLPLYGVGPFLISGLGILSLTGIILSYSLLSSGTVIGATAWIFRIIGIVLILLGGIIWIFGALKSDMDSNIVENKLKTDGIYSWVRNPMYTGWWFFIIGITLMWHNLWLLLLIPIDWLILTIVLKQTEEKWLLKTYGKTYAEYKKKVNRCIPWFPRKG